ncbi:type VI secretion system membrane subunit TssM [Erwinia amylovora]|uniref:type VI secretion system membrane subunit TssM n=1 Tax=Erwinia amylovora TaxID=552 RepID=UPI001443FE49|nr:type VI secretion system membrane subunit TssM [Erwinia amylovora]
MLNAFYSLLTRRLLWGLIGTTTLSALIWLTGPLLLLPHFPALNVALSRGLPIGLVWLTWFMLQLVPQLFRAWSNSRLLTRMQLDKGVSAQLQASEEMLDNRFNEATLFLKKMQFARRKGLLARFGTQYLYQLPWYLIVGAPGAGKTTALVNSGLEFPLGDVFGKTALRGVGGTRHCDWWFTRQGVLLDTAGRYTLQESQRMRDACEWQTFITLLKRYRPRQPINGVIMTISVADLLSNSAEARYAQASALRSRMAELHQQTGIHFPVYVMVTKTDLLKGFMRYFATLDKNQRQQLWGFVFPWPANSQRGHCADAVFNRQFSQLSSGLMADLSEKMAQEADLTLRAECLQFPQEFNALRPLLAEFLDIVFSTQQGEISWAARGLFFTSATQEGLPFDRIMGELSRRLQLPHTQRQPIASWDSINRDAPIPANKGQSFFIHGLLNGVIFPESRLAGSDRSWEHRNRLLHRVGYALLSLALLMASALWLISYDNNQRYLDQVAARLPAITQQASRLGDEKNGDLFSLLPFLNNLVKLPQSDAFAFDAPPISLCAGLYRGDQISRAGWGLYRAALQSLLLPRVAQTISDILRNDKGGDALFSSNALRAYQMLYQPRSYDGEFLRGWLMQNLQKNLPSDVSRRQLQQLNWHLIQLLDRQILGSPYRQDNAQMMKILASNLDNAGGLPLSDISADVVTHTTVQTGALHH